MLWSVTWLRRALFIPAWLVASGTSVVPVGAELVLVSVAAENRIAVYECDAGSGALTHRGDVAVSGAPGALCAPPGAKFLFAALRDKGQIASYRIDSAQGTLIPLTVVDAAADPAYLATDRSGRFLLSAYYVAGKVAVHTIASDGRLDGAPRWYDTDEKAHAIATDPTNRYALVPHTGPNAIFQFRFDAQAGLLTPNDPAHVTTGNQSGPRHVAFHPRVPLVFTDNEQGSSVSSFRFDAQNGTIKVLSTVSTLPDGLAVDNACARMMLTPSGKFLYAANRGHHSIAAFSIDEPSGQLTRIGVYPTEPVPRGFGIDSRGKFLIAAGQDSGQLATYRIADDGVLQFLENDHVGDTPWWVEFIHSP